MFKADIAQTSPKVF